MGASDGAATARPAMGRSRTDDFGLPRVPMIHVTTASSARTRVGIGPAPGARFSAGRGGYCAGRWTALPRVPLRRTGAECAQRVDDVVCWGFPKGMEVPVPSIPVFVGWVSDADL